MEVKEIIKKLTSHYLMRNDVALQMQPGLPFLEKKNEKPVITFIPHRELYNGDKIEIYEPAYEISWVYPFEHVIFFRDYTYEEGAFENKLICSIDTQRYVEYAKFYIGELFNEFDRILSLYEENKKLSDLTVKKYNEKLIDTAEKLGLLALYKRD